MDASPPRPTPTPTPAPTPTWRPAEQRLAVVAVVLLSLAGLVVGDRTGEAAQDRSGTPVVGEAGCRLLVDGVPLGDRRHLDEASAPPAAALYPEHRPAHSGRHFTGSYPLFDDVPDEQLDERVVTHNLEHGSVAVWFDPAQVDADQREAMQSWMRRRRAMGFESPAAGGIFVSPSDAIASGRAVALRAWGVAMDCDRFDVEVADAFLGRHWGSRGAAPEAHLSPFPAGVMGESGAAV